MDKNWLVRLPIGKPCPLLQCHRLLWAGIFEKSEPGFIRASFCGIIEDNLPCQPGHKRIAANFSFDNFPQDLTGYAYKEVGNISTCKAQAGLCQFSVARRQRTVQAAGLRQASLVLLCSWKRVFDKTFFKVFANLIVNQMVDNSVAEQSGPDFSRFWPVNGECAGSSNNVFPELISSRRRMRLRSWLTSKATATLLLRLRFLQSR